MAHFIAYASRSVVDQLRSVALKVCEATAIIFFWPCLSSCMRMAPHAISLASVVRVKSPVKSGNEMIGGEARRFLILLKALLAPSVQTNVRPGLFSSFMGAIRLENMSVLMLSLRRVSMNCRIHTRRPMRLCNSFLVVGGFMSIMARTYSGSALNPSLFTTRPRNLASDARKMHFSGFSFNPNLRRAINNCSSSVTYSSKVLAWTRLSSIYDDMFAREATVSRASAMHREKICPADVRPKAWRVYWKQRPFQVKAVLWRSS